VSLKNRPLHPWFSIPPLAFAFTLAFAACGSETLDPATTAALATHAELASWERLDDTDPPRRLRDPRTGVTFVRIPAGEFRQVYKGVERMIVVSKPFLLAETELTVAQWRRYKSELGGDATVPVPAGDDLPMPLSWFDAETFCSRLGYRLPTEAEWERACRADHVEGAPWSTAALVREHAWFNANAGQGPKAVRTRTPNGFGLYDMLGNVWEWCSDWYAPVPYGLEPNPTDPTGPTTADGHSLRGGSWFTPGNPKPTGRTQDYPLTRNIFYGLRPARDF